MRIAVPPPRMPMTVGSWLDAAACGRHDPELWSAWPGTPEHAAAVRICITCPVTRECAADTLARDRTVHRDQAITRAGVWRSHNDIRYRRHESARQLRAIAAGGQVSA